MTTRNYDSDANFFAYYFPITTPGPLSPCTITIPIIPLFLSQSSLVLLSQPRPHSLAHDS